MKKIIFAPITIVAATLVASSAFSTPHKPVISKNNTCPDDMKYISGMFCTEVQQNCIKYLDPPSSKFARCQEFAPTVCTGKKVHMDFCIDTEEHHPPDSVMPSTDVSWNQGAQECAQEGKRLCKENEWTLACEGSEMYAYSTGYVRPSDKCNIDKLHILNSRGEFFNQSNPITANPLCLSPFGVHDMIGNTDEFVILEKPYFSKSGVRMMSGLKGGHWMPARNRCRPVTVGHDEAFHEVQTNMRCCTGIK